jgi:hypothetical protein
MIDRSRLAASVAAVLAAGTMAWAVEPTAQQNARLKELENKIAALESQQAQNSKDLAATVDAVLRDAEKRSQLLATGGEMGAGYDNGFYIRAGDAWVFKPGIQFQFRNVTNYREDAKDGTDDDWENGFEVRRLRFEFAGTAFTKELTYFFQWDTNRDTGSVSLLEAWGRYMFSDDWGVRAGQFKDPTTHEFVMSSKKVLAVDTSLMDNLIGGGVTGYTQGVLLVYGNYNKNSPLNFEGGFTDGANQANTDFLKHTDDAATAPAKHTVDWGVAGRAEYKFMGDWSAYSDFTAKGTRTDLLVAGLAGDWTQSGGGDLIIATADLQYENATGLGAYGAVVYNYTNADLQGFSSDASNWGLLVQASYLVTGNWELFGRCDVTLYDNDVVFSDGATEDSFPEFAVGVNYYMGADGAAGHRAKFTVDLSYLPNSAPKAITGIGVLDNNDGEAEWMLRAQFQLLI